MALTGEDKAAVINQFKLNPRDTGSAAVQVALITQRLNDLTGHFEKHKKDFHSQQGLLKMVGRRRRLLDYIKRENVLAYRSLIQELGLRK